MVQASKIILQSLNSFDQGWEAGVGGAGCFWLLGAVAA